MATPDEVSITATEATVAGSSVAVTEAEEDAASFAQSTASAAGCGNEGKVIVTKSESLDISIAGTNKEDEEEEEDGEYTAPMHLHALRTPAKLKGARSRSSSRSRPGSRRNSVSPPRRVGGELSIPSGGISPSVSVESSLDGVSHTSGDIIDPDILLDKLGFRDLDPNVTTEELQELLRKHISSNSSLPTLNERMSEETMDDSHAFQDLQYVKKSSGGKKKEDGSGDDESVEKDRIGSWAKERGLSSSAVMDSSNYVMGALDEVIEEEGEDDLGASDNNIVLEIPDGMVRVKSKSKRSTMNSATAIGECGASSLDGDDDDEEDAEVDVPTAVMNELEVSDGRRMFKQLESSMAVAGSEPDYLEADEQDGLEADLSDTDR